MESESLGVAEEIRAPIKRGVELEISGRRDCSVTVEGMVTVVGGQWV